MVTTTSDLRRAAGSVADDYVDEADPNGRLEEKLCTDETFGVLANSHRDLAFQRRHGRHDMSEDLQETIEQAMEKLEDSLEMRAREVLD